MDEKELELYHFMKVALESGATIKMTEKGKGGLFVRGRKLTDKDLLECITDPKPKTKADCIRAMTDEELSVFLCKVRNGDLPPWCDYKKCETRSACGVCRLNWLKQKAE